MNEIEKFISQNGQKITMTSEEKMAIRNRLVSKIGKSAPTRSPYLSAFFFMERHVLGTAFAVVLFLSGTVSAFAERALPGELLYNLKIGVNEEVLGWFRISPLAKAEWSVELAERRLEEIEITELDSTVSADVKKNLENQFAEQIQKAEKNTRGYDDDREKDQLEKKKIEENEMAPVSSGFMMATSVQLENEIEPSLNRALMSGPELTVSQIREHITKVKKTTEEIKKISSEKGKILRVEAKLLEVQRNLRLFDKKENLDQEMSLSSLDEALTNLESKLQEIEFKALEDKNQKEGSQNIQSLEDSIKIPEESDSQKTNGEVISPTDIYVEQVPSQIEIDQ